MKPITISRWAVLHLASGSIQVYPDERTAQIVRGPEELVVPVTITLELPQAEAVVPQGAR